MDAVAWSKKNKVSMSVLDGLIQKGLLLSSRLMRLTVRPILISGVRNV